jgi:predicted ATPase/TPR repeat protein
VTLRLRAEHVMLVPPLAIPNLAALPPLAELAQIEAVALLLERLRAADAEFALTTLNALPLAAICVRVDGLPLAIELVASRGRLLGPQELLSEVTQQFMQLRRRGRDVPLRHQTLAAALEWSVAQLSPQAQALFARLSIFAGRWRLAAVTPVCDLEGVGHAATLMLIEELLEHSLIQRFAHDGETRLGMLAMVREFAQHQFEQRGEAAELHGRFLAECTLLARKAEANLVVGIDQAAWMAQMEAEQDNLRAALAWALSAHAVDEGTQLAAAAWRFWYMRGMLHEGRHWLESFIALAEGAEQGGAAPVSAAILAARAHALDGAAILAWRQGEYEQARRWLADALDRYRAAQDRPGEARVLSHLGLVLGDSSAFDAARAAYEQSLAISRELRDTMGMSTVLHNLGNIHCQQNDNTRALQLYEECLAIYEQRGSEGDIALICLGIGVIEREQGRSEAALRTFSRSLALARRINDDWTAATALANLSDLALDAEQYTEAERQVYEAQTIFAQLGDQPQLAVAQIRLGTIALRLGDRAAALGHYRQSLMLAHAIGFQPGIAESFDGIAACVLTGQPLLAAQLFAASAALRERIQLPVALIEFARHEQMIATIQRDAAAGWAKAWHDGQRLSVAHAVALALAKASV